MAVIAVIATLDTKGAEAAFLKQTIEKMGCSVLLIDSGMGAAPTLQYINATLISTFPAWRCATPLLVKKVSLDFFDKLLSELQNQFL